MKTRILPLLILALASCAGLRAQQPGNILHVEIGGGLHTLTYRASGAERNPGGGVGLRAEYRRFFNRSAGLGVGAGFSTYRSSAVINTTESGSWSTSQGVIHATDRYEDWTESQGLFKVSIPVSFYLQHAINRKWSVIWGIGPQLDIPVNNEYSATSGRMTRSTADGAAEEEAQGTLHRIRSTAVALSAGTDLGFHFSGSGSLPLYFGVYADYGITSFLRPHEGPLYSDRYEGLFSSGRVGSARTLSVGIKAGFSLNLSQTCRGGRCGFY